MSAAGAAGAAPNLDKLETAMFGFTYPNETQTLRLERLETEIYGSVKSGTTAQRLTNLDKDLAASSIGKEIAPREDTFADDTPKTASNPAVSRPAAAPAASERPAPGVDYPAVNELEQIVFNKEFKEKPLNTRLDALEQKTFKKTYASDDLSARVDRLQSDLKPTRSAFSQPQYAPSSEKYDYDDFSPAQNNYSVYRPPVTKTNLAAVEKTVFKESFPQDNLDNRLARLEEGMFGTTFDTDSQQERINRITSAHTAQKSAKKYDSNKFNQAASSGMQIGMFILMILACIL